MTHAWLLILFPLITSAVIAFRGRKMTEEQIGLLASGAVGAAFVVALVLFVQLVAALGGTDPSTGARFAGWVTGGPTWIAVGPLEVGFRLLVDPLSVTMALVVTGVGFAIHWYSRGYVHGDPHHPRFFALLNLFVGAMLILVMADNLMFSFVGWEGVGFCSYMLIGYYTERHSATQAGKKAFIVNRVGDLGFLLAMTLCYHTFGTLDYTEIAGRGAAVLSALPGTAAAIGLLLFVGACGKSAQFPLHVWLPDAMEGPTPVSALIHAATMVTAGVFMTVRMGIVYAGAPQVLTVVAVIGLFTALLAASMAMVQHDIKKVLAYSTVSQLGYMFLAAGVGAYHAAIFHLVTHAFFKGLLFLCSGSVIHAVEHALHAVHEEGDPQDMRGMGGLAMKLPVTHWTMVVGAAALAGVPGLAGFFSKDEILFFAGAGGEHGLGNGLFLAVGLLVAMMTAFYMVRLLAKVFWQPTRMSARAFDHLAESPGVMLRPLQALAVLSVIGGCLNLPALGRLGGIEQLLSRFLEPVTEPAAQLLFAGHPPHDPHGELMGMVVSGVLAVGVILVGWLLYRRPRGVPNALAGRLPGLYRWVAGLYFIDAFYQAAIVRPGRRLAEWLASEVDARRIDGAVNDLAAGVARLAELIRGYQPGFVRSYALWFAVGAAAVIGSLGLAGNASWLVGLVALVVIALAVVVAVVARPRNEG